MANAIIRHIPNTVTCLNLFSGCIACVMAFEAKYELAVTLLYHLKQTGVTGTCNRAWTRSKLSLFCQEYERLFSPGKGSVSLTYHPIYIIAKKR